MTQILLDYGANINLISTPVRSCIFKKAFEKGLHLFKFMGLSKRIDTFSFELSQSELSVNGNVDFFTRP